MAEIARSRGSGSQDAVVITALVVMTVQQRFGRCLRPVEPRGVKRQPNDPLALPCQQGKRIRKITAPFGALSPDQRYLWHLLQSAGSFTPNALVPL